MPTVVTIPGWNPSDPPAHATLREVHEITERHRRPVRTLMMQMNPQRFAQIIASDDDTIEGLIADPELAFTQREADTFMSLGDRVVAACLLSWTIDQPIPANADAMMDLPPHLYDALQEATKDIGAALLGSPGMEPAPAPEPPVVVPAPGESTPVAALPAPGPHVIDPYTVDGIEDRTSPTGASGA
jgi:hypothetical protein